MQAIILAAGMGRRLGRLTQNNTKCMLEVHGKTLIERSLDILLQHGIARTVIVVGYEGHNVVSLIGDQYKGMPIVWIWNKDYETTNNIYSLYLASEHMKEDDTLLLESDLIFDSRIIESLLAHPFPNLAVVSKYESWMDGTVVTLDEDDNIVRFIPKKHFSYDELGEYYKTVNIYKFSKEFLNNSYIPFLSAYSSAMGNNEYYEQVLRIVIQLEKQELRALRLQDEKWYEIDDIQDLNNAETVFAEESQRVDSYVARWGGYWRFPDIKDFCFLVNPYFPPAIMLDEMKAYFQELLASYPSGQAVQRILAAKLFNSLPEQILVGNGAAELINALMTHLDGRVGIVVPTFHEYPNRVGFDTCAQLVPIERDANLAYSVEDIQNLVEQQDVDTFVLINPDNPSGHYLAKREVLRLAHWFEEKGKRLIVDESFIDFSDENLAGSLLSADTLAAYPHLIVIKSISKSYGVPGIRLGVLACHDKSLLAQVKKHASIWNINSFGEFFLQIIGKYEQTYLAAAHKIRQERDRFYAELRAIPFLRVIPSQSNYFLCEVTGEIGSARLCEMLISKFNVLVKDCSNKPGLCQGEFIRIAVRNRADNEYLIQCLQQCC